MACDIETIPWFSPFSSINLTCFAVISSLMRGPSSSRTGALLYSFAIVASYGCSKNSPVIIQN